MALERDGRSPIWGGATLGLLAGIIIGFFTSNYWQTVSYAVAIGTGVGIVSEVLFRITRRPLRDPYANAPIVIRPGNSTEEVLANAFSSEWQDLTAEQRAAIILMFERTWRDEQRNYPTLEAGVREFRRIVGGQLQFHADVELRRAL